MNICHVVYECLPGRYAGGVQKMVYELACAQSALENSVEIWTIGSGEDRVEPCGLKIRYFSGNSRWRSHSIREAMELHAKQFDVFHGHNTFLALNRYVGRIGRKRLAKTFYHPHGALDPVLLRGWSFKAVKKRTYVSMFEKANYDFSDGVIGLTEMECEQIAHIGIRAPIYELNNGIELAPRAHEFSSVEFRVRNQVLLDDFPILFVGRITEKKGIHFLIEAMPEILRRIPSAVLVICGGRGQDVSYVKKLDEIVERLKLFGRVVWAGFVDEIDKRSAFASARLFAHPSYSEGMALAILEAMAAGIPTIVTPGCYMGKAVNAGALLQSEQSAKDVAESIVRLSNDPSEARQIARCAVDYVGTVHGWNNVARRLDLIYRGDPSIASYRPRL